MNLLKIPQEKRFDIAPALEGRAGVHVPVYMSDRWRRNAEAFGWSEETLKELGVVEFLQSSGDHDPVQVVEINTQLEAASKSYMEIVRLRRELAARIENLQDAQAAETRTGIRGLAGLFEEGAEKSGEELTTLRAEYKVLDEWLKELKRAMREVVQVSRGQKAKPTKMETEEISKATVERLAGMRRMVRESGCHDALSLPLNSSEVVRHARETLYGLARRGDAERKYVTFKREDLEQKNFERKNEIFGAIVRLRQRMDDAGEGAVSAEGRLGKGVRDLALAQYRGDVDRIVDSALNDGFVQAPDGARPEDVRAAVLEMVLTQLGEPTPILRKRLEDRQRQAGERKRRLVETLSQARHADLFELILEREVQGLMRDYHIRKKRFIPLGEIKAEMEDLERIVTGPNGPILRAFLYGPPGTGKTESLREIGAKRGQNVRVISLHETSTFETLVGMHQIPLPKAETLADAERYWSTIQDAPPKKLVELIPSEVLDEFVGEEAEQRALDFRKWFESKLVAARSISAIGAVSPEDSRIRKAQQAALAAWLDQPLAQGLIDGDLIILDEADRAGNALEGLQDLLTRHPGQRFHPPGRPQSFAIHPQARVVMTANWGDVQTEMSGGQGRISAPIASRVVERRKVNYLHPQTETQLFEVMTSNPDGESLLTESEHTMAECLINGVFPRMRDMYLRPGELQFLTPMSVRTLENIKRRLVDETTRTRVLGRDGKPVHFVEAAWTELASGPFREDQRDRIIGELAKIFAASGMFNQLKTTPEQPGLKHQVARLTGLDPATVESFVGAEVDRAHADVEAPRDYSFGSQLAGEKRATNHALRDILRLPSPRTAKEEEERAWRRDIEDRGGNPDIQRALDGLINDWFLERAKYQYDASDPNQTDRILEADVRYLSGKFSGMQLTAGDVRVLQERLPTAESADDWPRLGLVLSLAINKVINSMPKEQRSRFSLALDLTSTPGLEHLGYRMPAGQLTLRGRTGNFTARELEGGTVIVDEAGDKLAYDMRGGKVMAQRAGKRACQRMRGGRVEIEQQAGERLGMDAKGGTVVAAQAGDFVGQRSSATFIIGAAGARMGEELGDKGRISVKKHGGFGFRIQGNIEVNGAEVYRNGQKVAA